MKIEILKPPFGPIFDGIIPELYTGKNLLIKQSQPYATAHLAVGFLLKAADGALLGRAALYNNPSLCLEGKQVIALGAYECVSDNAASWALIDAVEAYCKKAFPDFLVIGPMDGSSWKTYRYVTEGLEHGPFLFEPFFLPYYPEQWRAAGFSELMCYASNLAYIDESHRNDFTAAQKAFESNGLVFRTLDVSDQDAELRRLAKFNLKAFQSAFLFSEITEAEFMLNNQKTMAFLLPKLVHLVLDGDEICGMILAYPDLLDPDGKTAVVKTLARLPGARYRGLGDLLCDKIVASLLDAGFQKMIHALMRVGNDSLVNSSKFWGEGYKRYTLFQYLPA